jgi:hypothetical protein
MLYVTFCLDLTVVYNAISTPDLDNNIKDVEDPPDLLMAVRIDLAHQAWIDAKGELTISTACRGFGVNPSTLHGRIYSAIPKALASQAMQRLTVLEEKAIQNWLLDLAS